MSLETVAEDVTENAREHAERIREEGDRRAEEILERAGREAEEIEREREEEIETELDAERERRLSGAKLEAKQQRLEARRNALEATREEVEERIAAIDGEEREGLTRELLEDATEEFDGDATVRVSGRAEDRELLESILADDENLEYAGEYDCLGGVVAASETSRVRVTNTFDSVLEDVWEAQLQETSRRLFEE